MAAPVLQSTAGGETSSGTSHTVTVPAGTLQDDFVTITIGMIGGSGAAVSPPSGYTEQYDNQPSGLQVLFAMFYRFAPTIPDLAPAYTSALSRKGTFRTVVYGDGEVDATTPITQGSIASGTSTDPSATSVTPPVAGVDLNYHHATRNQSSGLTPPSGMTERGDIETSGAGANSSAYRASQELTTTSASGTRTPSALGSSEQWAAVLYTVNGIPAGGATSLVLPRRQIRHLIGR